MGLKCAPDIAQECMEQIFRELQEDTEVYIDDIGCFSNDSWEHPLQLLDKVCSKLQGYGLNSLLERSGCMDGLVSVKFAILKTRGYSIVACGITRYTAQVCNVSPLKTHVA